MNRRIINQFWKYIEKLSKYFRVKLLKEISIIINIICEDYYTIILKIKYIQITSI